jgi:hypothetical protein
MGKHDMRSALAAGEAALNAIRNAIKVVRASGDLGSLPNWETAELQAIAGLNVVQGSKETSHA